MANEREEPFAEKIAQFDKDHPEPHGKEATPAAVNRWRVGRRQFIDGLKKEAVRSAAEKRVKKPTKANKGWTEGSARTVGDKASQVHYDDRPRWRR